MQEAMTTQLNSVMEMVTGEFANMRILQANMRKELEEMRIKLDNHEQENKAEHTYASKLKTKNTLVIKSTEDTSKAVDHKKDIMSNINTQVEQVKSSKKGHLVVKFDSKAKLEEAKNDLDSVKDHIKVSVDENIKYKPKIMVCDVDDSEDDIIGSLKEKNQWINNLIVEDDDFKLIKDKKKSRKENKNHAIIKCSPEIRKVIHLNGDRLYTIYGGRCRVFDSYKTYQCYNCQEFGHSASRCTNAQVCAKCSGNHSIRDCHGSDLKCQNCTKKGHSDTSHKAFDRNCPVIKDEIARIRNKTDHGF